MPRPKKGSAEADGRFGKEQFTYDAATDTYRCPEGRTLSREVEWLKRGEPHIAYAKPAGVRELPACNGSVTSKSHRFYTF